MSFDSFSDSDEVQFKTSKENRNINRGATKEIIQLTTTSGRDMEPNNSNPQLPDETPPIPENIPESMLPILTYMRTCIEHAVSESVATIKNDVVQNAEEIKKIKEANSMK